VGLAEILLFNDCCLLAVVVVVWQKKIISFHLPSFFHNSFSIAMVRKKNN
jgi:hypothetical protein